MKTSLKKLAYIFKKINKKLEERYKGKIIAIEIDSEDYFIGDSELDAYNKAKVRYPDKKFFFKRIGFTPTHFVGTIT